MKVSQIENIEELETAVYEQLHNPLCRVREISTQTLQTLLKVSKFTQQDIITKSDINNLDLPDCVSLHPKVFNIKDVDYKKSGVTPDDVFFVPSDVAKMASYLRSNLSKELDIPKVDGIAIDFSTDRYRAYVESACPHAIRKSIALKMLKREIRSVISELKEYEKFLELKAKYDQPER